MFRFHAHRKPAGLLAIVTAGVAGVSAYAYTASNTVTAHSAGAGSAAITGYTVSSPTDYTFNGDATQVIGVSFTLDKAANDVAVALVASPTASDWVDCGQTAALTFAVTCDFSRTPVDVANAVELSVAAVSTGTVTIGS